MLARVLPYGNPNSDVFIRPDLGIRPGPTLARLGLEANPQQIMVETVVDDGDGQGLSFGRLEPNWRVQLG